MHPSPDEERTSGQPSDATPETTMLEAGHDARRTAEQLASRLAPARRARRRTRLRQAVAARRRSLFRLSDTASRLTAALLVLGIMALVSLGGGALLRQSTPSPEMVAARATAEHAAIPTEIPTVAPAPRPTLPIPPGPEISQELIEANGPTAGCILHRSFAEFGARIGPALLGQCVEQPQTQPNGDVRQRTVHGELFWYAVDSRTAYTDGHHVWMTGPDGIGRRRIEERFAWERDADAGPRPVGNTHVLPPALPGAQLPAKRIVSYYGNPLSSGMGILGELPPEQLFARLK